MLLWVLESPGGSGHLSFSDHGCLFIMGALCGGVVVLEPVASESLRSQVSWWVHVAVCLWDLFPENSAWSLFPQHYR